MMKRIITIILMLTTGVTFGQIYQKDPSFGKTFNRIDVDKVLQIPGDTTNDGATDRCKQIAKKGNIVYTYNCDSSKWVQLIGASTGTGLALDSARRSNDTLYFKRTTGGELAVPMNYYTKQESDARYVLIPSGKITANWLTAWDYCISYEVPNITNPDLKYLIVNGNAGDTVITVTGGTGTADFTPNFVAVAYDKAGDHYNSYFVIRQSGSEYHLDRPLKYSLSADTVKFLWSSWQGQHMTDYGYRGYADMIYDYHRQLAARDYKLYSFYPEDNDVIPFVAINGAVQGSVIPGTSSPQVMQITSSTISYSQIAQGHYLLQQGSVAGRGVEWSVNLGKKSGYLETWVGVNKASNLPGFARVLFYLDGVLIKTDTVRGGVQKLTYSYSNASSGKVQIVTGDTQPVTIKIGRTVWNQTDIDPVTKVYTGGKILFVGDSWTQHWLNGSVPMKSSPERFRHRWVKDGGDPADIINVGRGGMTSTWGRYFLDSWLDTYKPKYTYFQFYINDANSSGYVGNPSVTTWNFNSNDPYAAGTDVDGKVTQAQWKANLEAAKDTIIAHGSIPIMLMNTPTASVTQTQTQSAWFSANHRPEQYYDIETGFFSTGVFDNNVQTPTMIATNTNTDTISTRYIKGGVAGTSTGLTMLLQSNNSSINKGLTIKSLVNYAGVDNRVISVENSNGSDFSFLTADGFLHAQGFNILPTANRGLQFNKIFNISYASGIARISATNSSTVNYLYVGDSITRTIRMRIPVTFPSYATSALPTGLGQDEASVVYDNTVKKLAMSNGANVYKYFAIEDSVKSRYDSNTTKLNFLRNSAAYNNLPQFADIFNIGNVRLDLGSDAGYDMYYRDIATGRLTRLAPSTYGSTLKAGPGGRPEWVDESGTFIRNTPITNTAQSASWNITGQGQIAGSNSYKLFLNRPNMTQSAVLAFKNGTDTAGYLGLGSLLSNDVMVVGLKGSVSLRTRDTARIIFGSHSPEYSYVVGKKGKWKFGDSVQTAPTVPIEVESAQDTSILASHKIIGNGLISNSTITASSAPAYLSGGISPIGRNNTSGRFEAYTPTLDQVTTSGNTTSNVVNVGSLGVSGAIHHSGAYYTPPKVVTATYSVLVSDHVILVNNNSAATITLPSATGLDGLTYEIKKISNNANNVTIATTSSQLVDDGSAPIITYNKSIKLMAYNGGWKIMAIAN